MRVFLFSLFLCLTSCAAFREGVLEGILARATASIANESFVELICVSSQSRRRKKSKNPSFTNELCEIHGRPVMLKRGPKIQMTYKFKRQHKQTNFNYSPNFTSNLREDLLSMADLEKITIRTTEADYTASTSSSDIIMMKPKFTSQILSSHDVPKKGMNDPSSTFFQKLGVTDKDGKPRPRMSSKLKQCNKFVEVVGRLLLKEVRMGKKN